MVKRLYTITSLVLAGWLCWVPGSFAGIAEDFAAGLSLEQVVQNAHADPAMSAEEAVRQIMQARPGLDEVDVIAAVMNAWPGCDDAVAAVRSMVEADNEQADEIVRALLTDMQFHCAGGNSWVDRIRGAGPRPGRVETGVSVYAPLQCFSVYRLVEGAVSGLDERQRYVDAADEAEKAAIVTELAEEISEIVNAANRAQEAECACSEAILAGVAAALQNAVLQMETWDMLPNHFGALDNAACEAHSLNFVTSFPPQFNIRARRFSTITGPQCDDPTRCSETDIASPN